MSQIKIQQDLPQGELPQREESLRKTLFCDFMRTDLPLGQNTQREERLREKRKMFLIKILLGSASMRTSTERRKTKKKKLSLRQILMNFDLGHFTFFSQSFSLCVIYPRVRSVRLMIQNNFHLEHFTFFLLVFFLSVEVLLETDPNDFDLRNFPYYSQFFFSMCNLPQEKVRLHNNTKKVFLSLSSLCGFSP